MTWVAFIAGLLALFGHRSDLRVAGIVLVLAALVVEVIDRLARLGAAVERRQEGEDS